MLKVYVLTETDGASLPLVENILNTEGFSLARMSYDVVDFILSANSAYRLDLIIVDRHIDESDIARFTDILLSKFKFIIYSKNPRLPHLSGDNIMFLERHFTTTEIRLLALKLANNEGTCTEDNKADYKTSFFIRCEKNRLRKIHLDNILMVEADQNYIKFHEPDESFLVNFTLNGIEKRLPPDSFIRIHRSFIVNIDKISVVEPHQVIVGKDVNVPIGQSYRKKTFDFFNDKLLITQKILQILWISLSLTAVA